MTKSQAKAALRRLGFEFDEAVTGRVGNSWMATIDAIGRRTIDGDCVGIAVHDYTATASEFWQECVVTARGHAQSLGDCPHAPGECEFHDGTE